MIRHQFDITAVEAAVAELDANWLDKSRKRTARFIAQKAYKEASSIWSTVKPVYMRLQHDKCVFCEQRLEGGAYGPVTWDLEHFRPKSNVEIWPDPTRHSDLTYTNVGTASTSGYYWLAYELRNYAASCKVCNSIFKLNWFPIAAVRALSEADTLSHEQAFLCYPLGEGDVDPEELVTFTLTTAVPTHREGPLNQRGRIIIDFFGLNKRDTIHRDRAQMIGSIGMLLEERDRGGASAEKLSVIEQLNGSHIPHAACVRAFKRLWEDDAETARRGYEMCLAYGFDPSRAPPTL